MPPSILRRVSFKMTLWTVDTTTLGANLYHGDTLAGIWSPHLTLIGHKESTVSQHAILMWYHSSTQVGILVSGQRFTLPFPKPWSHSSNGEHRVPLLSRAITSPALAPLLETNTVHSGHPTNQFKLHFIGLNLRNLSLLCSMLYRFCAR